MVTLTSPCLVSLLLGLAPGFVDPPHPPLGQLPSQTGLPPLLIDSKGQPITQAGAWFERRKELLAQFEHFMYGKIPPKVPVKGKLLFEDGKALGGKATLREVRITLGDWEEPYIHLLIAIPNAAKGKPVPTFLGINFHGNSAALDDPRIALSSGYVMNSAPGQKNNRATDAGRGGEKDKWVIEETVGKGYGVALFHCADLAPDKPGLKEKLFARWPVGEDKEGDATATISAWAWGMMRALDYLETVPEIDGKRVAAVGHSRLGKTALVAGAFDDRFALVIPHQAGCGGTAPSRGKVGESVKQINDRFPHWFCRNFKLFNDDPSKLPFDQHALVGCCAPRPVLFSNALEDTLANPDGQFEVLKAADPVYRLVSPGGLDSVNIPPLGELSPGLLGYWKRSGKHSMTAEDWKYFCLYADRYLKK